MQEGLEFLLSEVPERKRTREMFSIVRTAALQRSDMATYERCVALMEVGGFRNEQDVHFWCAALLQQVTHPRSPLPRF